MAKTSIVHGRGLTVYNIPVCVQYSHVCVQYSRVCTIFPCVYNIPVRVQHSRACTTFPCVYNIPVCVVAKVGGVCTYGAKCHRAPKCLLTVNVILANGEESRCS